MYDEFLHRREVIETTITNSAGQDVLCSAAVINLWREPTMSLVPDVGDEHDR